MTQLAIILLSLLLLAAPLGALAYWGRIYPQRRLVYLALLPALAAAVMAALPAWQWIGITFWLVDGLLVVALAIDLLSLPARGAISAERHCGRIVSLRKPHRVELTLVNQSPRDFFLDIRDGVPRELNPQPAEVSRHLPARSRLRLSYVLRAGRRGAFSLSRVYLRAQSHWRFWQRLLDYPAETLVHVYPDMQQLGQYAAFARTNRLSLLGVRRTRKIGQDHDFERWRDYTIDDNY